MKFLHLGDLHLGKDLLDFSLIDDQKYILNQIIDMAKTHQVDAILMSGDIYDRPIPPESAVQLFDTFLRKLVKEGIQSYIITGNHDSDERLNFGSSFFESNGIHICAKYDGELYHRTFTDAFGDVNLYLLPFVKASMVRHKHPDAEINNYNDAVRAVIDAANVDTTGRNVILSHQFVTGSEGRKPDISGSEMPAVQNVGLVEEIGYTCFDAFDYAALGHIHRPQQVGREAVRYAGSMLKYSLSEAGMDKSVPLVTLGEKGQVDIELLPLKPMRDLRHITGTRAQLLDPKNICDTQDYMYVTLTDEDILNDAMGIFQQYYPNTVRIDYKNSHTKEMDQVDLSMVTETKSFEQLIKEFYKQMYGQDMNDEEMQLMAKAAKEAGIEYEAD